MLSRKTYKFWGALPHLRNAFSALSGDEHIYLVITINGLFMNEVSIRIVGFSKIYLIVTRGLSA